MGMSQQIKDFSWHVHTVLATRWKRKSKDAGCHLQHGQLGPFQCRLLDRTMLYTVKTSSRWCWWVTGAAFEKAVTEQPSSSSRQTGLQFALKKSAAKIPGQGFLSTGIPLPQHPEHLELMKIKPRKRRDPGAVPGIMKRGMTH